MLLQRIQQQFIDSADLQYQCAQSLAPAVESALGAILASVTSWLAVVVLVWGAVRASLPLLVFGGACCLVATARRDGK